MSRRPLLIVGVVVAAVLVFGSAVVGVVLARRAAAVPNPVSAETLPPVAEVLRAARENVLAAPRSAEAWGAFASVCDAHQLYDEAALAYQRAHELDRASFRWIYLLAIVEDLRGSEPERVWTCFREAMERNPVYPPLFVRYGDALVHQGEMVRARDAYRRATDLDPDFAMAHRGLGQVLLALGDLPAALAHLQRATTLDPSDGIAWATLARAFQVQGDEEQADAAARRASTLPRQLGLPDPLRYQVEQLAVNPAACNRRAAEAMRRGDYAAALPELERLVEMLPGEADYWAGLGRALERLGRGPEALDAYRRAASIDPGHAAARDAARLGGR